MVVAPTVHKAKAATINRAEKARFTTIIRFIIKRRKGSGVMRILGTVTGVASFFNVPRRFFPGLPMALAKTTLGKQKCAA